MALGFIFTLFVVRGIEVDYFGRIVTCLSITGIQVAIADLGAREAFKAFYLNSDDASKNKKQIINCALLTSLGYAAMSCTLAFLLLKEIDYQLASTYLLIALPVPSASFQCLDLIDEANKQFKKIVMAYYTAILISIPIRCLLIFGDKWGFGDSPSMAASYIVTPLIITCVYVALYSRNLTALISSIAIRRAIEILKSCRLVVLAVFFASVTANLEILWAAFFISKAFAGEVGFVMRLFSPGIALSLALAVVSFPALSKSIAETSLIDNRTILRVFREANMASFLFILAIGLGSIFLYQYWLPQDYTNIWWLFIAFGICFPLTCHGNLRKNIFILLGRQNLLFKSTLYTIVIKIVILGTLGIIFGKYALLPACALSMLWANLIYAKNDSVFRSIYSSQLRSFSILEAIKDKP